MGGRRRRAAGRQGGDHDGGGGDTERQPPGAARGPPGLLRSGRRVDARPPRRRGWGCAHGGRAARVRRRRCRRRWGRDGRRHAGRQPLPSTPAPVVVVVAAAAADRRVGPTKRHRGRAPHARAAAARGGTSAAHAQKAWRGADHQGVRAPIQTSGGLDSTKKRKTEKSTAPLQASPQKEVRPQRVRRRRVDTRGAGPWRAPPRHTSDCQHVPSCTGWHHHHVGCRASVCAVGASVRVLGGSDRCRRAALRARRMRPGESIGTWCALARGGTRADGSLVGGLGPGRGVAGHRLAPAHVAREHKARLAAQRGGLRLRLGCGRVGIPRTKVCWFRAWALRPPSAGNRDDERQGGQPVRCALLLRAVTP